MKLYRCRDRLEQLADELHQKARCCMAYFDCDARSSMLRVYAYINYLLVKWCCWKYNKFKGQALRWLKRKWQEKSQLFAHWQQSA